MVNPTAKKKQKPMLSRPAWFALLVVVLALAYFLGGQLQPGQERYMALSPDRFPPGSIQFINLKLSKGGGMYVVNDAGTFYVLVATDPYDRCRVSWRGNEQAFVSPCSKSTYHVDGSWRSGSSPGGLDQFPASIVNGNLMVDTETRIKGTPRPVNTNP